MEKQTKLSIKNNLENDFQLIKHVHLKKLKFSNSVDGLYLSLQNKNTFKKTIEKNCKLI